MPNDISIRGLFRIRAQKEVRLQFTDAANAFEIRISERGRDALGARASK